MFMEILKSLKDWYVRQCEPNGLFSNITAYIEAGKPTLYVTSYGRMYYKTGDFIRSDVVQKQIKELLDSDLIKKIDERNKMLVNEATDSDLTKRFD